VAEFFEMPQASPTMEAGRIIAWRVAEGDKLSPQDVIAEVETDKAAMEIEVFDEVYLLKILEGEDAEVPAGRPIAILGSSPDEDISALVAKFEAMGGADEAPAAAAPAPAPEAAPAPAVAAPAPAAAALDAGVTGFTWQGQELPDAIMEMPVAFTIGGETDDGFVAEGRVRAAPAARQAALSRGIDLTTVRGTGPRGRVLKKDVESAKAPAAPAAGVPAVAAPADELVKNSMMRKTIAKRLTGAWQDAPAFFLTARFDCDALVDFRNAMKAAGVKVSYNDIIIKACARALRDVPDVNVSWGPDAITKHGGVHIGVAVALDGGLITPVVRDADHKGLSAISSEVRDLAGRAREGKLQPGEYSGSTFTISNLGMMGIEHFTAILNPPEACILAVGGMAQEPVVVDGQLSVKWQMRVTLTCDHRAVDGALGAQFLQAVRRYIEHPALLAS
jgi:pyruvate dehydrogenase E2 component (dihydrolipoamide acetyltransferase)